MVSFKNTNDLRSVANVYVTPGGVDQARRQLSGQVFDSSGAPLTELRRPVGSFQYFDEDLRGRSSAKRIPAAIYGHHFHGHYGHYLLETYAGLAGLQEIIRDNPSVPVLMHPFNINKQNEMYVQNMDISARALGISAERLILIQEPLIVEELLYQPLRCLLPQDSPPRDNTPSALAHMRRRLRQSYGLPPVSNPDKILYVSRRSVRQRGPKRRLGAIIEGEEVLEEKLENFGVHVILPEHHSFEEQLKVYGEAKAIIAFHGSGLHNIILAEAGTHTILLPTVREDFENMSRPSIYNDCPFDVIDGSKCFRIVDVEGAPRVAAKASSAAVAIQALLVEKELL